MKNIYKIFAVFTVLFLLASCEKDEDQIVLNESSKGSVTADKAAVVLNNGTPNDESLKFTYTLPTFNPSVVPSYSIEFGLKDTNFAVKEELVVSKDTLSAKLTHKELNDLVLKLGAKPGELTKIEARLKTSFNSQTNYYSNVLNLDVTPFVSFKNLYLVGNASEADWNNNNNNLPLFRDPVNVNKFYFTGYFAVGAFKLIEKLGEWHPQWGANGAVVAASNPDGTNEPGTFNIATAGYYTFQIDINTKVFSLTPYSGPMATYTTVGIIGSATPDAWNSDQDMVASILNPHIWKINNVALIVGEAKFRAANDWGTNWGGSTPLSGTASLGGTNIPVNETANYDVYFNDLDGRYLFIKK